MTLSRMDSHDLGYEAHYEMRPRVVPKGKGIRKQDWLDGWDDAYDDAGTWGAHNDTDLQRATA